MKMLAEKLAHARLISLIESRQEQDGDSPLETEPLLPEEEQLSNPIAERAARSKRVILGAIAECDPSLVARIERARFPDSPITPPCRRLLHAHPRRSHVPPHQSWLFCFFDRRPFVDLLVAVRLTADRLYLAFSGGHGARPLRFSPPILPFTLLICPNETISIKSCSSALAPL